MLPNKAQEADPEAAEAALPRPDQVAQAAAISQDILIAPHEAEALFPDADASPEIVGAEMPSLEAAEAPSSEPAAAPGSCRA